jgi:hypothetical protein
MVFHCSVSQLEAVTRAFASRKMTPQQIKFTPNYGVVMKISHLVNRFQHAFAISVTSCLVATTATVLAHTGNTPDEKESKVDCRTVFNFTFPKLIEFMSEIDCNQFISSNSDWNWRYPNSYFDRPFISAFSPRTRKQEPGLRFFRRIVAFEIEGQAIQEAYDNIFTKVKNFPDKQLPKRLIRMDTVNDIKDETHIWFGFSSEDKGWAVVCAPECAPEYLFLIEKR